ncbi:MAG TPA: hypothetical protein VF175_16320 [Lacipirellula sp.]
MTAPAHHHASLHGTHARRHAPNLMRLVMHSLLAATALGCGGGGQPGAHLQGKVTIDGNEIPADAKAHIMFAPESASDAETVTAPIVNSRYDCPNAPLGSVTAYFEISRAVGPMKRSERTGAEYQEVVSLIPADRTTGIQLEVTGDKADQDFDL